jgi:uncharacterized MAPEG superfamily protein
MTMTTADICLLAACVLPIACTAIAKWGAFGKSPREGGYDNRDPRAWLARQEGYRARANAAQANSFEALPLFIVAVLVAQRHQAPQTTVDLLALAFIALRLAYIGLYVGNRAAARSIVWLAGVATCVAIFFSAA